MKQGILIFIALMVTHSLSVANSRNFTTKPVTFLIYYSGDNNLSQFMKNSLDRVVQEGAGSRTHVVIQYDGNKMNDSLRLAVNIEGSLDKVLVHEKDIEYDMGQAQTLIDFVDWGRKMYPSDKLVLLVFAHGRGVLNVPVLDGSQFKESAEVVSLASSSDDSAHSYMSEQLLVKGLKKVLGNQKIDLLIYNSCLMGNFEVMNMFSEIAHAAIASEYPIYLTLKDGEDLVGRAISIENILKNLKEQSTFHARDLSKKILKNFSDTYQDFVFPGGDPDHMLAQTFPSTLAFYNLDLIGKLSQSFTQALQKFRKEVNGNPQLLHRFFKENLEADYVDSLGYMDLLIFYRGLIKSLYPENSSIEIKKFEDLHSQVVTEKVALHLENSESLGHLSLFFPSIKKELSFVRRFQSYYSQIEVPRNLESSQFLDFIWTQVESESSRFWISMLKKWSAGETVFVTSSRSVEYADYFFFLELDVQAIRWAQDPEGMKTYLQFLNTIERTSPEFQAHLRYVKSLYLK